jgi:tRNA (adenine37-N6)-methyltransferase
LDIKLKPIGIINSKYKDKEDSPRQGRYSDEKSVIKVFNEYIENLEGIELHKYYMVFYWQDRAERDKLKVVPHDKTEKRGVFSTRAPVRPNPIGFCLVKLLEVKGNELTVQWLDALDGSPLLDIKPFWKIDLPDMPIK